MVGVGATMVEVNSAPHRETMEALWERVLKWRSQKGLTEVEIAKVRADREAGSEA